jgi:DNA-binding response OmpR family regulator
MRPYSARVSAPTTTPTRILVVEDDANVAAVVKDALEDHGYQAGTVATGAEARALVELHHPHLIILDLVLPDEDGLLLCSRLKVSTGAPILVCSGTQRQRDEYLALKLGADDFIAKPFDVEDLVARVEAMLGRTRLPERRAPTRVGGLLVDYAARQAVVGGVALRLTPIEFRLLGVLADHSAQGVAREALAWLVWGYPDAGTSRTIDVHVGRLRTKLREADPDAPRILSVRGLGYKLIGGT